MSRTTAQKAKQGLNMVAVSGRNFRHEDDDGKVQYLPTPYFVEDARPLNWHGEPVKYGHYVKVRCKFDDVTFCVQSKHVRMLTDVLVNDGVPYSVYENAVSKFMADRAEAAKQQEENVVFRARNILAVTQLLGELGIGVTDEDDDGFKLDFDEEMVDKLKACGVLPVPSWLNSYSVVANFLCAFGMLDPDELHELHS